MIDHTNINTADASQQSKPLWNQTNNKFGWQSYLADGVDKSMLQYASASCATDLTKLPATYICVGDQDLFYKENMVYSQRLKRAGVSTQFHAYAGGFHGFAEVQPTAKISKSFNKNLFNAIRLGLDA